MQQIYAYYSINKLDCEMLLAELLERGLEIVQFQVVKEAEHDYSLYVVVRIVSEEAWLRGF